MIIKTALPRGKRFLYAAAAGRKLAPCPADGRKGECGMSKKRNGLLIAFGAVLGAAVAGVSYYLKYKSFNDELEQDFHDYEEEEGTKEEQKSGTASCADAAGRCYIHINSGKNNTEEENEKEEACQEDTREAEAPALADENKEAGPSGKLAADGVNVPEEPEKTEAESAPFPYPQTEKESVSPSAVVIEEDTDGADA